MQQSVLLLVGVRVTLTDAERTAVCASSAAHAKTVAAVESVLDNRMSELYQDLLNPEFGAEWREPDGIIYNAVQSALADQKTFFINLLKKEPSNYLFDPGIQRAIEIIENA